jgi:NAD(P)-dependent dehydrogenase (short-subunit alcohol dehydrogenase family)
MTSRPTALVTGATRGIGTAIVAGLAARGYRVHLGARDPEAGRRAADAIDGDVVPLRLDVDDPGSIAAALAGIERLDVLVNNAAINLDLGPDGPLAVEAVSADALERTLRTNVVGLYAVTVAALPALRRATTARVVNLTTGLASVAALQDPSSRAATRRLFAYTTSKAAVNALTLLLAHELRADGVLVNAADPGYVSTAMNGFTGTLSVEQGAAPVLALATETAATGTLLGPDGATGW